MLEGGSRLVGLEARRQGQRPVDRSASNLREKILAFAFASLLAIRAADRQCAVLDGDVDVLRLDARQSCLDHQGVLRARDIEWEAVHAIEARAEGATDEAVLEQAVHRGAERHELAKRRWTANDRHVVHLQMNRLRSAAWALRLNTWNPRSLTMSLSRLL